MITTVTLNPCIDFTVALEDLRPGQLNLVDASRRDISGKGVNVSVVLKALGVETRSIGVSFEGNGKRLEQFLDGMGIPHRYAMAQGDIRTNIKVLDTRKNEMTELNSRGAPVPEAVLEEYLKTVEQCAVDSELMVFSGRIPNGAAEDIYQRSMEIAAAAGTRTVVDAEGKPLRLALRAKPYLMKPNVFELEHTFGFRLRTLHGILEASRELIAQEGVEIICVSMGGEGALIASAGEAWYAKALEVEPRGFQGAGDSMVAGLCKGILEGSGLDGMLRNGVAAASASLIREGTQLCRAEDFEELREQVELRKMED